MKEQTKKLKHMWQSLVFLLCIMFSTNLNAKTAVLAFAGSSRADSVNKKLILQATRIANDIGAEVEFIDLRDYPLPLYDADFESAHGMPENVKRLRNLMIKNHVILISSPEHNSSLSALLKNTIDWISRSEMGGSSRECLKGKKCLIMSASPGRGGGARGLVHLKEVLEDIGGDVNPQFITVPNAYHAFDAHGNLKDPKLYAKLHHLIEKTIRSP